jgi:hypothetical protein
MPTCASNQYLLPLFVYLGSSHVQIACPGVVLMPVQTLAPLHCPALRLTPKSVAIQIPATGPFPHGPYVFDQWDLFESDCDELRVYDALDCLAVLGCVRLVVSKVLLDVDGGLNDGLGRLVLRPEARRGAKLTDGLLRPGVTDP